MVPDPQVRPEWACPGCGERRMDWLVWTADDDHVVCATCGAPYDPADGELHPCDRPGCDELTADISGLCPGCLADEKAEQLDYQGELETTRYGGVPV
jgi:hypothetical protein